ncbi:MAG: BamA/TamA family outer membrane protein [Candidatus Eremiobacterota bacterium]
MLPDNNVSVSSSVQKNEKYFQEGIMVDKAVEKSGSSLPDIIKEEDRAPVQNRNFSRQNRISAVEIQGNNFISKDSIEPVISIKPGDDVSSDALQKDLQAIYNTGYFTDVKFDPEYEEEGMKVIFRVLENPHVTAIKFKGNELVSSEELSALMKTEEGKIFNSNDFEEDLRNINNYYTTELGMTGIATHITDVENQEKGVFILSVSEGFRVSAVDFSGNTAVSKEELSSIISTKPGDYLNVMAVNRDLKKISALYDEKYSLLLDEPLLIDTSPSGVVTYKITEVVVDKIVFSGNTDTKDYVIRRELKTEEGKLLDKKLLSEDIKKLNNLGFFDEINVEPKPSGTPGHMILEFNLKEARTGLASAGVGFSGQGNEGISGSISLSEKNLFGTGRNIQLVLERGSLVSNYSVNYGVPYLAGTKTALNLNLFYCDYQEQKQSVYNISGQTYALYRYKSTGGMLTLSRPVRDNLTIYGGLNISNIQTYATPTEDNPVLASTGTNGDIRSLSFSALYDTRDLYMNPHSGLYNNVYIEQAGFLGGDFNFTKYYVDNRKFFPLGDHVIALRALAGSSSGTLPLSKQYALGGDNLRGYEAGEFTGDNMILLQAEYRFPILNSKILQGAVFFDAGNISTHDSAKGLFERLNTDQGVGVRVDVPALGLGTIRFDYSIRNDNGDGRINIGLGQSF